MPMTDQDDQGMRTVSDQAAEWFIRLRDRDLTMTERRKYVRWLKQSPNHIAEFMRLCRLYGRVKRAKLPTLPPEVEESNVVALMQHAPLVAADERRPGWFDSRRLRLAVAACCLAVVGVIVAIALSSNTIQTDAGEWRTVQLADGSTVSTGPNTLMRVEYSKEIRRINLARGEAMFKVMKDSSRPFIVNAGGAVARAVGTRFGVERRADLIRVTVAEGKVAVVRGDQAAALEHAVDLRVATALAFAIGDCDVGRVLARLALSACGAGMVCTTESQGDVRVGRGTLQRFLAAEAEWLSAELHLRG